MLQRIWLSAVATLVMSAPVSAQSWVQLGPSPTINAQVEGMGGQNNPVSGSINALLAHPTNSNIFVAGATNGGIWTTSNASGGAPTWTARGQQLPSLSIGALAWDMNDATFNTIWAGTARNSSFGEGGRRSGVYRSFDGGATWGTVAGNGLLAGQDIVGLVARGNTIITAARSSDNGAATTYGIFRSTNGGSTFTQISGAVGAGLSSGRTFDLAGDPSNANRLFTAVSDGTTNGFYRSLNAGATWSLVSPAAMNTDIAAAMGNGNVKITVGASNNVYVSVVPQSGGQLASVWRSGDGGTSWVELTTLPSAGGVGIHPGGQGRLHMSIVADPTDPNILYVGGDRQPSPFPNSIGANNFTGRLFRGQVTNALTGSVTWQAITHNPDGDGTNVGAPHADSRRLVFDASGRLIETDDGGIYRRVNPTNANGAWSSLNGNLQVAETHSSAWDRKTNTLIAGTQDTGTVEQISAGGTQWRTVNQGDGGRVAVDNAYTGVTSFRYTSSQFYGGLRRREYNASNTQVSNVGVSLTGVTGSIQFYGPLETNRVVGGRLYVATNNVFESTNALGSPTFTLVNSSLGANMGASVNAVLAGGRLAGVDNPDVLYAGTFSVGGVGRLFLRTTAGGTLNQLAAYNGGSIRDIAANTENWQEVYVIDNNQIFRSINAGGSFADITSALPNASTMEIQTIEYVDLPAVAVDDVVLIGGRDGVFYMRTSSLGNWFEFGGATMPNVPVLDLQYVAEDNLLMAGTLGRGLFTLSNFTSFFSPVPEPSTWLCIALAGLLFFVFRQRA
jgi:hypothetical protein